MLLRTMLTCLLALDLAAAPAELNELVAAQKSRREACEESLRELTKTCPGDSAKWREARLLYRKAEERSNAFLDALILDIRHDSLRPDYRGQIQEAEAAAAQAQNYLDTALCDGTTTQGRVLVALPILFKLTGAVSSLMDAYKAYKLVKAERVEKGRTMVRGLEAMRWRPMEEFLPGGETGKDPRVQPAAAAPRFFCLETGFHSAAIRCAALDPAERILATVAEDKTLRLFDPRSLAPLRVLRPPMGRAETGKLYALALSADGNLAAVSGFTRDEAGGGHRIYLMDTRDGHLLLTLPGLPQVVNALAISPDGQTLMAHLGGRFGLRAFRLADGAELARDESFLAPTYAGAFAANGSYAVSCDDGYLRLYGPGLKAIAKMKAPNPSPFGLAFSPDGKTLAVGYADGCRVDLLDGRNLLPLRRPAVTGLAGPLSLVAWSRDGQFLYAGGGVDFGPNLNPVVRWAEAGRGERRELPLARATLASLLPLADGGLLAAAQDPLLARLGKDFKAGIRREAQAGDPRQAGAALQLDASGAMVSLGRRPGQGANVFSVSALGLQALPKQGLAPALLEGPGLKIDNWRNREHPTLNGKPLEGLQNFEVARCLSVAPEGRDFALGTDWFLRLYDAQGRPGPVTALPAACWGLSHSRDGRVLVAALADGTLRWYKRETAEPLMSLYVDGDGLRWILWQAEGYYCAGVGGEALAGWQVQRPGEAGDFFPVGHFRAEADQPRLFPLLLQTRDLSEAAGILRLTRPVSPAPGPVRALPPVLRILDPLDGAKVAAGSTDFRIEVRAGAGDPVQSFQVRVDGQKLGPLRGVPPRMLSRAADGATSHFTLKLPVPDRDCRISVAAQTAQGVSEPCEVSLKAPRSLAQQVLDPARAVSLVAKAPDLHVLAVGVGAYQDPALKLKFPAKDARDIAELFEKQRNGLYGKVQVTLLTDAQASKERVLAALRETRDHATARDVTLVFLSGHGATNASSSSYCFLPWDARVDTGAGMIDGQKLREALAGTEGKVVLFLDTCHAGNVMGAGQLRGLEDMLRLTRLINELTSAENGVSVFSASTGKQLSLESPDWENGAFTMALREGLGGRADPGGQGKVTLDMLDAFLRARVRELTQGLQTPVSGRPAGGGDFPLVALGAGGGR